MRNEEPLILLYDAIMDLYETAIAKNFTWEVREALAECLPEGELE